MMKTTLLALALAVSGQAMADNRVENDTVVVRNPRKVTVVTGDSLQSILIEGSDDNPNYRYSNRIELVDSNYVSTSAINRDTWDFTFGFFKKKRKGRPQSDITSDFALGFCGVMDAPEQMDVKPFKSWEIWWLFGTYHYRPWHNGHAFSVGMGFDWRNYRMVDNYRFAADDDKVVTLEKYADGAKPRFSRVLALRVHGQTLRILAGAGAESQHEGQPEDPLSDGRSKAQGHDERPENQAGDHRHDGHRDGLPHHRLLQIPSEQPLQERLRPAVQDVFVRNRPVTDVSKAEKAAKKLNGS